MLPKPELDYQDRCEVCENCHDIPDYPGGGGVLIEWQYKWICKECLIECLKDFDPKELAELLGSDWKYSDPER